MKVEYRTYGIIGIFFAFLTLVYFVWSGDGGNSILLLASGLLGLLPGAYLGWWSLRMAPRPEDQLEATPSGSAGDVGAFPTNSPWPFVLGLGAWMIALGFVFGIWLAIVGLSMGVAAAFWGTLASRRGGLV